ncbi:hypothetical protein [Streptomyces sp. NRRL S-1868]|uniref:hypothetical protein n=1 Tax=Streptomyces sp. NRRL S-1868 TaxID=1463892 RepID=UPI0004C99FBC|nr:hypothetical protein [Streptomyces sp. NRRL S-1868]
MTTVPVEIGGMVRDVDLEALTPRARTVAEALTASPTHFRHDIWLESEKLLRDRLRPEDHVHFSAEELDRPVQQAWSGWTSVGDQDASWPVLDWLEQQARKIPPHWHVYGPDPHTPVPSLAEGAADDLMWPPEAQEYLRQRGVRFSTEEWFRIQPEPERFLLGRPQWSRAALDAVAERLTAAEPVPDNCPAH